MARSFAFFTLFQVGLTFLTGVSLWVAAKTRNSKLPSTLFLLYDNNKIMKM